MVPRTVDSGDDNGGSKSYLNALNVSPSSSSSTKENLEKTPKKRKKGSSVNRRLTMTYSPKRKRRPSVAGSSSSSKSAPPEKIRRRGRPPSYQLSTVSDSKSTVCDVSNDKEIEGNTESKATSSSILRAYRRSVRNARDEGDHIVEGFSSAAEKAIIPATIALVMNDDTGYGSTIACDSTSSVSGGSRSGRKQECNAEVRKDLKDIIEITHDNGIADVAKPKSNDGDDANDKVSKSTVDIEETKTKENHESEDTLRKKVTKEGNPSDNESFDGSGSESESSGGDSSDDDDAERGVYVVERIDDKKILDGTTYYFIKWKGWHVSANTWEPIENLDGCSKLLDAFEKRYAEKKRRRITGGPKTKRRDADIDEAIEDTQSHMKSYGILTEWPADKEPISVEGVIHVDGVLTYVVKRKVRLGSKKLDRSNAILVHAEGFRQWYPELVIQFYESRVFWATNIKTDEEQACVAAQLALLRQNKGSLLGEVIVNDMDTKLREEYKDVNETGKQFELETQVIEMSSEDEELRKEDALDEIDTQAFDESIRNKDHFGLPEDMEETDTSSCVSDVESEMEEMHTSAELNKKTEMNSSGGSLNYEVY